MTAFHDHARPQNERSSRRHAYQPSTLLPLAQNSVRKISLLKSGAEPRFWKTGRFPVRHSYGRTFPAKRQKEEKMNILRQIDQGAIVPIVM
jgi:hypothetical protein